MARLITLLSLFFQGSLLFSQAPTDEVVKVTTYRPDGYYLNGDSNPGNYHNHGGRMFFTAVNGVESYLYHTDGQDVNLVSLPDGTPVQNEPNPATAPQRIEDRLYFFSRDTTGRGLWFVDQDPDSPQAATHFGLETTPELVATQNGVLIVLSGPDHLEIRHFDGQTTRVLDQQPAVANPFFRSISHQGEAWFMVASADGVYPVYRSDGITLTKVTELPPPINSLGLAGELEQGTALLSLARGVALIRQFTLNQTRYWTLELFEQGDNATTLVLEQQEEPHYPGIAKPFVQDGNLFFLKASQGLHFLDGNDIRSMDELAPGFNDGKPSAFAPATGGFYYVSSEPGRFDNQVLWFDQETRESTLLYSHHEDWVDNIFIGTSDTAWFPVRNGGIGGTGEFNAVWTVDGGTGQSKPLVSGIAYYGDLGLLDDMLFFAAQDHLMGREPVVAQAGQTRFLADLNTSPPLDWPGFEHQMNFSGGLLLLDQDDNGSLSLVFIKGAQSRVLANLDTIALDRFSAVDDRLFLFADNRRELWEVTETGLNLLVRMPLDTSHLSRVMIAGNQLYYTSREAPLWEPADWDALWTETALFQYLPDATDQLISQGDDSLRHHIKVVQHNNQIFHTIAANGTVQLAVRRDGVSEMIHQIQPQADILELDFLGDSNGRLLARVYHADQPRGVKDILAIDETDVALVYQGDLLDARWNNGRLIFLHQNQILAVDATSVQVVAEFDGYTANRSTYGSDSNLYFNVDEDLWISDGTAAGTRLYLPNTSGIRNFGRINGYHYFWSFQYEASQFYVAGPNREAPAPVQNMPEMVGEKPGVAIPGLNRLYFLGQTPAHGAEIWYLEGDKAVRATDLAPGPASKIVTALSAGDNGLYFQTGANESLHLDVNLLVPGATTLPDTPDEAAVTMTAPQKMAVFRTGRATLEHLPAHAQVNWHISGGFILSQPTADSVLFKAGVATQLTLTAVITMADGEEQTLTQDIQIIPLNLTIPGLPW